MDLECLNKWTREASLLLTAVANQKRMMILCLLRNKEHTVSELGELVNLGQSPLSQHLAKLRDLGLVSARRRGQSMLYSLQSEAVEQLLDLMQDVAKAPREKA